MAIVFLLYFGTGKLGLSVPFTRDNISPLWPSAGIAIASVLVWGYAILPAVLAAAFFTNFSSSLPATTSGLIAIGNTASALVGGYLLRRMKVEPSLIRLRDVLRLMTVGAALGPIIAATFGVTALYLRHLQPWSHFGSAWRVWWSGDAMGVLVAAPLFLAISQLRTPLRVDRRSEFIALLATLLTMCLAIFTGLEGLKVRDDVLAFLLFPFVMWAAIRFRIAGASVVAAIIAFMTVWGTARGYGPFVSHPALHDVLLMQLFFAVASSTGLILAAVISEREHISAAYATNQRLLLQLEETQNSLKENRTQLELAQQAARMGVWEWDIVKNQVVWSLGTPALYAINQSSYQIPYHEWLRFVHPEDRGAVARSVEDALAGRREHDLEFRTLLSNHEPRWLAGRGTVFRTPDGRPVRMIGICVDITELKQIQSALRQTHEELEQRVRDRTNELAESNRALLAEIKERIQAQEALEFQTGRLREQSRLLDLANDAIIIRTLDGAISYWNEGAERLYGWSKEEALAKHIEELVATDLPLPLEEIKKTLFKDGTWQGELQQTKRDGTQITVSSNWTLWRDQQGTPRGWLQIDSNISQRKQAENALRELSGRLLHLQDEERRRLARELHDSTGQSLAALQMHLSLVQKRTTNMEPDAARLLATGIEMTEQMVKEIRTLSYLLHPPLLEESGLASALRWYVDGLAQRSNIKIDLRLSPDVGRFSQDLEIAIFRIVQECLTNIHRHASSPTASIRISRNADEIRLLVADAGVGIPAGLWESDDRMAGVGVGISGMKERVRELGGQFRIRPGAPGTIVEVDLPIVSNRRNNEVPEKEQPVVRVQA